MQPLPRSALAALAILGLTVACSTPSTSSAEPSRPDEIAPEPPPPTRGSPATREAAAALVASEPAAWWDACAALPSTGSPDWPEGLAGALVDALREAPSGPGAQPALAVLGELDVPLARGWLLETAVAPEATQAAEAALALGRGRRTDDAQAALATLVTDPGTPRLVRTSAAATLLDWGDTSTAAPFLHAVLVGGTPEGQAAMRRFGLEDDTRWALDRTIAIAAIDRWAGRPQAYRLDPDLPWPTLARRADRFLAEALDGDRR